MRILLLGTTLPLLAVCLSLHGVQASVIGVPVPKPTAAGQSITSSPTAPFTWAPVTLPYGLNGTGQMAVGGTVDATSRLSVNPQGTGENGLTVNMPSGATGQAIVLKNIGTALTNTITTTGTGLVLSETGDVYGSASLTIENRGNANGAVFSTGSLGLVDFIFNTASVQRNIRFEQRNGQTATNGPEFQIGGVSPSFNSATLVVGDNAVVFNRPVIARTSSLPALVLQAASGQTADLLDITDSTNAVRASVNKNFVMTAKGFASSVRVVTGADTATLTDSVLLCNGTFTETLPATGYPTGYRLTVKDTGTGTITLTAGGTVTFDGATTITFATQYKSRVLIFDGTNFQIESGLL